MAEEQGAEGAETQTEAKDDNVVDAEFEDLDDRK
jgi:molecular chaperone DnaK